jgi:putative nucleotidyltransferase with HDIG domain
MERLRQFLANRFEILLVFSLFVAIGIIHFFVSNKLVFLNFYFLPTLVSGFYMGRRSSIATGLLSIALVCYFVYISPESYGGIYLAWNLVGWGCFLMLTSIVVGTLYEQNQKKKKELKDTYDGVLEILSKFIEAVDRYTKEHSVRVSELSIRIGKKLGLTEEHLESLRIAGLLHDVGKIEISNNVIMKAAKLPDEEISQIQEHPERGAEILSPFRSIFRDVVSIVLSHHHYFDGSGYGPQPNKELALA